MTGACRFAHAIGISAIIAASSAAGAEFVISLERLPKQVSEAVKGKFPMAEVIEVSEKTDDEVVYEVTVRDNGKKIDVTIDADGDIESLEREIDGSELPKVVREAIAKTHSDKTIEIAEAVYEIEDGKEELDFYEAQLKAKDGKQTEAMIKADGTFIEADKDDDE